MKSKLIKNVLKKAIVFRAEDKLIEVAKSASRDAIRQAKANGLSIKIIKDHKIISIDPRNNEKVVGYISRTNVDLSGLKKGTKLTRHIVR